MQKREKIHNLISPLSKKAWGQPKARKWIAIFLLSKTDSKSYMIYIQPFEAFSKVASTHTAISVKVSLQNDFESSFKFVYD